MTEKMMLCGSISSLNDIVISRYMAEEKFDGERIKVIKKGKVVSMINRRGAYKEEVYIELKEELQTLDFDFIIDGEVCSTNGIFNDLQRRALLRDTDKISIRKSSIPIVMHVFDIMELNGLNTTLLPLIERKKLLTDNFANSPNSPDSHPNLVTIKLAEYVLGEVNIRALWNRIINENKEGIILKVIDSIYVYKRSNAFLKYKNFKEIEILFNKYEVNNAGVKLNDGFHEVQVQGVPRANWIIEKINKGEHIKVIVQYLEKSATTGKLRFPSCKEVVGYD